MKPFICPACRFWIHPNEAEAAPVPDTWANGNEDEIAIEEESRILARRSKQQQPFFDHIIADHREIWDEHRLGPFLPAIRATFGGMT